MRRTHNARIYLAGVAKLPIGWVIGRPIGGRFSRPEYRNDEDLYTFFALCGELLVFLGFALIVIATIFRALRKIDKVTDYDLQTPAGPAPTSHLHGPKPRQEIS